MGEKAENERERPRVDVRVSAPAADMLAELQRWLFPSGKRTQGLVIEQAIRELHARIVRERSGQKGE